MVRWLGEANGDYPERPMKPEVHDDFCEAGYGDQVGKGGRFSEWDLMTPLSRTLGWVSNPSLAFRGFQSRESPEIPYFSLSDLAIPYFSSAKAFFSIDFLDLAIPYFSSAKQFVCLWIFRSCNTIF